MFNKYITKPILKYWNRNHLIRTISQTIPHSIIIIIISCYNSYKRMHIVLYKGYYNTLHYFI